MKWIHCFLENRYQVLTANESHSRREYVKSEQFYIGPVLFIIMLNAINRGVKYASLLSFVDDTQLWNHMSR